MNFESQDAHAGSGATRRVLVDGHVHVYPAVPIAAVLHAVERAMSGPVARAEEPSCLALVVADPRGVSGFARLERYEPRDASRWSRTDGGAGHVGLRHDGRDVVFLKGQQIVTREGLEVIAAGARRAVGDGLTLGATLAAVRAHGGWSTIAWGAGKWLGRRGRLVLEAVRSEAGSGDVMLGDNGGRPSCWFHVPQFAVAAERGMPVLAGSDPLPIAGDEARIASYGFAVSMAAAPADALGPALRAALATPGIGVTTWGRRVGAAGFVANQWRLRTRS